MKVYIASSHNTNSNITQQLVFELQHAPFEIFFPESIGISATLPSDMSTVDKICCTHLRQSDILVAIYPFGLSVSVEIGRFLQLKNDEMNFMGKEKKLIILNVSHENVTATQKLLSEAMIMPNVDIYTKSIPELIYTLMAIYSKDIYNKQKHYSQYG